MNLTIYIGLDTRNDGQLLAFEICKKSILRNTKHIGKLRIRPLIKKDLEDQKLFYRNYDSLAATEFTYTRFLAPYLNKYEGVAVFCDSDFLWECDIYEELMPYVNSMIKNNKAVLCVQHDYTPKEGSKMDGRAQTVYPRKNWSSLIVFNCSHENVKNLTVENVNIQTPAWLHRILWCKDENIGELPHTYNYLVGVYDDLDNPKAIHYTDGGPWHYLYQDTEFADKWTKYLDKNQKKRLESEILRQEKEIKY